MKTQKHLCLYTKIGKAKLLRRTTQEILCGTEYAKKYLIKIIGNKFVKLPKNVFMRGKSAACNFCTNQLACLSGDNEVSLKVGDIPNAKEVVFYF